MDIARMFQVMPSSLKRLPLSEYRSMIVYYKMIRHQSEKNAGGPSGDDEVL